jgi:heat shock protein HslJ
MRILISLASLLLLPLLSLGCSTESQPGTPSAPTLRPGTTWILARISDTPALPEGLPHLKFAPDPARVTGSTGVNRLSGPYTLNGKSLKFGPMAVTKMAATSDDRSEQESRLLTALGKVDRFESDKGTLVLKGSGETLTFRMAADEAAPR